MPATSRATCVFAHPSSASGTKSGAGDSITSTLASMAWMAFVYARDFTVPSVAITPTTPESKMPMEELAVGSWPLADDDPLPTANCQLFLRAIPNHRPAALSLDVVLLDLLVQIRSRGVDGFGCLRHVPAVLAQLGQD